MKRVIFSTATHPERVGTLIEDGNVVDLMATAQRAAAMRSSCALRHA